MTSFVFDKYVFSSHKTELSIIRSWLDDERSKEVFDGVIHARANNDFSDMRKFFSKDQYFAIPEVCADYGVLENYFDAGAFVGDTVEKYLFDRMTIFNKIYAFEPGAVQYAALQRRCKRLRSEWGLEEDRIVCEKAALSDATKEMYLSQGANNLGGAFVCDQFGEERVKAYSLDEYMGGKSVGFLKADVEGEELKLLQGAKKTIQRFKPRMAICIYHNPKDFYQIPFYIAQLNPDYRFAVRHHSMEYNETVLYCW